MIRRALPVALAAAAVAVVLANVRPRPGVPPVPQLARAAPAPAEAPRISERRPTHPGGRVRSARGPLVATPFSALQVRVTLTGRELTRIETLTMTGANERSNVLNERAEPLLRERALRAGSAEVDVVTGATYTSVGYLKSLQAAIDRARRED